MIFFFFFFFFFFYLFVYENIFLLFFAEFKLLMFHNDIVRKFEQAELVENLSPRYLPDRFLHNLHAFLLWEKVKIFDLKKKKKKKKKKKMNRIKLFVHR